MLQARALRSFRPDQNSAPPLGLPSPALGGLWEGGCQHLFAFLCFIRTWRLHHASRALAA